MFCKNCGKSIKDDAAFCPYCSTRTNGGNMQPVQPQQNWQGQAGYYSQGSPPYQNFKPVKAKKRSGCLTSLLVLIGLIAAAAVLVYFLVPGLLRPYDLNIKTSQAAYESAVQKLKLVKDKAPVTGKESDYKYVYGEAQQVDTTLSSEEITSFFNINRPDYYALKNVQVRINPDNTMEAAGDIDVSYVFGSILNGKYSRKDAEKALPMLGLLPNNVRVYMEVSGGIKDNKLNKMSIDKASVMGIPIPESLLKSSDTRNFINENVGGYLERVAAKSNTRYDLVEVNNGSLHLKGNLPSSISRIPVK